MPYFISGVIPSYTDAFFETMSGFTGCGATILADIEALPKCMLFWRAMTHYMGGMGIVVFMVAIFPLMGIGGMQMVKTEPTGPTMQKIMPKIAQTAKILWCIYFGLTLIETILLSAAGLTLYDALSHSMSTIATGGFSTRNASVASFNSAYVDAIVTAFMFLSGINFALYFSLIFGKVSVIKQNTELKVYTGIFLFCTAIVEMAYDVTDGDLPPDVLRWMCRIHCRRHEGYPHDNNRQAERHRDEEDAPAPGHLHD